MWLLAASHSAAFDEVVLRCRQDGTGLTLTPARPTLAQGRSGHDAGDPDQSDHSPVGEAAELLLLGEEVDQGARQLVLILAAGLGDVKSSYILLCIYIYIYTTDLHVYNAAWGPPRCAGLPSTFHTAKSGDQHPFNYIYILT